jgi:Na+/H+-dicarboxylate symporter
VIASLIVGAASLDDIKKLGRVGLRTFSIYVMTTAIAITIGLTIANVIQPGNRVDAESKERLLGTFKEESAEKAVQSLDIDVIDFFVNIVPKNPIEAIATGEMLQIVFAAIMFGITLTFVEKKYSKPVLSFFEGVSQVMIKMVDIIMLIAPFGVFALIAATIADFGFNILYTLIWYGLAVIVGLLIQTYLIYGSLVGLFGKIGVGKFYMGLRNAQAIAFSTSSSAATLPITFDCVENKLGVKKQVSGFVLPLGATINMDGTALYQGVAAVFIAQVYGIDLNLSQQLTIVLTAVLASIGTAPVPGVGLIMLVMILDAVNIPKEGIALILGVDRILDMIRTVTNVTGDSAVAVAINGLETKKS